MATEPGSNWLAIESNLRSTDGRTDTEVLGDGDKLKFLMEDAPVVWHIFKSWGIQWWRVGQTHVLTPGRYKIGLELFNDVYWKDGKSPTDPRAMEWRVVVDDGANGPQDAFAGQGEFLKWWTVAEEFESLGGTTKIWLEVRCRWGIDVTGAWLRNFSLEKIAGLAPVDLPDPDPVDLPDPDPVEPPNPNPVPTEIAQDVKDQIAAWAWCAQYSLNHLALAAESNGALKAKVDALATLYGELQVLLRAL
jgi:hypothetical protein